MQSACKTICSKGSVQKVLSNGTTTCDECTPGKYANQARRMCSNCSVGRYTDLSAQEKCSKCEFGKYAPRTGLRACVPCAAGFEAQAVAMQVAIFELLSLVNPFWATSTFLVSIRFIYRSTCIISCPLSDAPAIITARSANSNPNLLVLFSCVR